MKFSYESSLLARFNGHAPVSLADIECFHGEAGFELPKDYAEFLQQYDGGEGFIGPNAYVIFWRLSELAKMNEAYQVKEYAPWLFIFGSNGGGEAFAFDRRTALKPIVSVPFLGMEKDLAHELAPTFQELLQVLSQS